jgi:LytS/YehU family sensor histidine kinase
VTWSLPEGLADARIPAMILQPLVENAIVHGLEPLSQGGQITVSAHAQGQELNLEVRDESAPGRTDLPTAASATTTAPPATQTGEPTRFGLDYVRQRLLALYGATASLTLSRPDHLNGTLATLKLPLIR